MLHVHAIFFFFFFNDTAPTEIYTLSLHDALPILFSAALVWYGWQVVEVALRIDEHSATDLQFPMWIYYASLPAGGALMLARYLIRLVVLVTSPAGTVSARPGAHEMPTRD